MEDPLPFRVAVRPLLLRLKHVHPHVYWHGQRVAAVMRVAATRFGVSRKERCRWVFGALLHDVGKLVLPASLLMKSRPLGDHEWARLKRHVHYGLYLVEQALSVEDARPLAPFLFLHHERPDGEGYPLGLTRGQIPREVHLLSIADAYVAMREPRPYRPARSHEEVMKELHRRRGTQFEEYALDEMLPVLEQVGSGKLFISSTEIATARSTMLERGRVHSA